MKHFGLAVLGAFALLILNGPNFLSAATQSDGPKPIPAEAKTHQVNGKVMSMDPQTQQLVVKGKENESSFVLTSETVYKKGRKSIKPGSLKTGTTVRVRYYEQNGQLIADRVTITSAGSPRKGGQ